MNALADFLRPRLRLTAPWPAEIAVAVERTPGDEPTSIEWRDNRPDGVGRFWVDWGNGSRDELTMPQQTLSRDDAGPRIWLRYVTDETMAAWPLT